MDRGGGTKVLVDNPTVLQGTGTGLTGIYWDNPDFTDHRISRVDPVVDFSWGAQTPDPSISAPTFSAKWVGQVQAQYSEVYTFIIEAPNGYDGTVILNEDIIIDSGQGENTIVYSTPTPLVAGQWYDIEISYKSYGGTAGIKLKWSCPSDYPGNPIPQWAMQPLLIPAVPPRPIVAASGLGRMVIYWDGVPQCSGYNVYRGSVSGGQNYLVPLNGFTLVTETSYPGASTFTFVDATVSNGAQYYYTIKAVYGQVPSSPSTEDSDIADSESVRWHSRSPSTICSDAELLSPEPWDPDALVRVLGPDGAIYERGNSAQQPPDGVLSPSNLAWELSNGTVIPSTILPDPESEPAPPSNTGPFRRILTKPEAQGQMGFRKVSGRFTLPPAGVVSPYTYPTGTTRLKRVKSGGSYVEVETPHVDTGDTPHVYLGGSSLEGAKVEVDAGLMYAQRLGDGVRRWWPFMAASNPIDPVSTLILSEAAADPESPAYAMPGDRVALTFYLQRETTVQQQSTVSRCMVYLTVVNETSPMRTSIQPVFAVGWNSSGKSVRMKRVHSIAQILSKHSPHFDFQRGYRKTGSYSIGAVWDVGRLYNPGQNNWTSELTLPGSLGVRDFDPAFVGASVHMPYSWESNIRIDLRP